MFCYSGTKWTPFLRCTLLFDTLKTFYLFFSLLGKFFTILFSLFIYSCLCSKIQLTSHFFLMSSQTSRLNHLYCTSSEKLLENQGNQEQEPVQVQWSENKGADGVTSPRSKAWKTGQRECNGISLEVQNPGNLDLF